MAIKYDTVPEHTDAAAHDAHARTNGTPPQPAAADAIETIVLVVDRCLGRNQADQRFRRTLAQWLAGRHPEHPESWWLQQWGMKSM